MEEERENGVSIGDIFKIAFTQKWLALIIAVVITLVGTLSLYFFYSRPANKYYAEFTFNFPDVSVETFPGGERFKYSELISMSTLNAVKASDEKFANIDVAALCSNEDAITITQQINTIGTNETVVDKIYRITAKQKYFPSKELARDFIQAVANAGYYQVAAVSYFSYLSGYSENGEYEKRITALADQFEYLTEQYSSITAAYGSNLVISEGKTLVSFAGEVETLSAEFNKLKYKIRNEKKVKSSDDDSWFEEYRMEYVNLRESYTRKKAVLDSLLNAIADKGTANLEYIVAQTTEVEAIKAKLEIYETYYLDGKDNDYNNIKPKDGVAEDDNGECSVELDKFYESLKVLTTELESVSSIINKSVSTASFAHTTVIKTDNGISVLICLVVSLVAGVIVAFIASYVVGKKKMNRTKSQAKNNASSEDKPAEKSTQK